MKKRRKQAKKKRCIAFLATSGNIWNAERKEQIQERVIREYAKAHNVQIVGIVRKNGFAQSYVDQKYEEILGQVAKKNIDGVIVLNMASISSNLVDAYTKVGMMKSVLGEIITVDEGNLELKLYQKEAS